jgi:hypothetical protein
LKNEEFSWTKEETKDLKKMKEAMCKTLGLATLNFKRAYLGV